MKAIFPYRTPPYIFIYILFFPYYIEHLSLKCALEQKKSHDENGSYENSLGTSLNFVRPRRRRRRRNENSARMSFPPLCSRCAGCKFERGCAFFLFFRSSERHHNTATRYKMFACVRFTYNNIVFESSLSTYSASNDDGDLTVPPRCAAPPRPSSARYAIIENISSICWCAIYIAWLLAHFLKPQNDTQGCGGDG